MRCDAFFVERLGENSRMERRLIRAAGLGVVVMGAPAQGNALTIDEPAPRSTTEVGIDLSSLVGSDELLDARAILEARDSALDSSGCVNQGVDTSGIIDWFAEPVLVTHAPFATGESMGIDMANAGSTIAVLSQSRAAIFELNEQNQPEFKTFTTTNPTSFQRQVAVAPSGDEIAIGDANGTIEFYRRSPGFGWGATPAQVLISNGPNPTGKSLAYSSDGAELYAEVQGTNLAVRTFQRNTAGNWEAANVNFPEVPTKALNRAVGWTSDRLLVSGDRQINVYRRTPNGFELNQTLNLVAQPEQLNVSPGGFSVRAGQTIQFFSFFQVGFFSTLTRVGDLTDVASITIDLPGFAGLSRSSPGICSSIRFHNQSNVRLGSYFIPNGINVPTRSIVSGYWGMMFSTISQNGTGQLYVVAQNRIFGGPRQGGFE